MAVHRDRSGAELLGQGGGGGQFRQGIVPAAGEEAAAGGEPVARQQFSTEAALLAGGQSLSHGGLALVEVSGVEEDGGEECMEGEVLDVLSLFILHPHGLADELDRLREATGQVGHRRPGGQPDDAGEAVTSVLGRQLRRGGLFPGRGQRGLRPRRTTRPPSGPPRWPSPLPPSGPG